MFVDLEDALLLAIIILGTAGAACILLLRARVSERGRRAKLWGLYVWAFLWVFLISDVAEHINRVMNPHDARGTMFARAFLLIGIALVVYLRVSERVPASSSRLRDKEMQQEEGEDI